MSDPVQTSGSTIQSGPNEELGAQLSEVMSISTVNSISTVSRGLPTTGNDAADAQQQDAPQVALTGIEEATASQPTILTPSRLRIDSRVLVAHATSQWLMNALFAVLILLKLGGPLEYISWFTVFVPQWIGQGALYCLQITILYLTVCERRHHEFMRSNGIFFVLGTFPSLQP